MSMNIIAILLYCMTSLMLVKQPIHVDLYKNSEILLQTGNRGQWQNPVFISGSVKVLGSENPISGKGRLLIYLPLNYKPGKEYPLVVALHGWNHLPEQWKEMSTIASFADLYSYVIVCPDMGTSVYETRFFPETKKAWNNVPGTPWLLQVVLPFLKEHYPTNKISILGYSTGGRGAVMAVMHGGPFQNCASLSGTFDLATLKPKTGEYRIHAQVYGDRSKFSARWVQESCNRAELITMVRNCTFYLGHGEKDSVVDSGQTHAMGLSLTQSQVTNILFISPNAGHDWPFWNSQLGEVFKMMEHIPKKPLVEVLTPGK